METLSVVEDFDVVEDRFSGGFTGGVVFMVHAFGFQGVKKAIGGVLTAPVGVPQQALRFQIAMSNASLTSLVFMCSAIDKPTTVVTGYKPVFWSKAP